MAEMQSRYISLILSGQRKLPTNYAARALRDRATEREYYSISPDLDSLVDWNAFLESVARRVGCESRLPASCVLAFNAHMLAVVMLALHAIQPPGVSSVYAPRRWYGSSLSSHSSSCTTVSLSNGGFSRIGLSGIDSEVLARIPSFSILS